MVSRRGNGIFNSLARVAVKYKAEICANFHIAPRRYLMRTIVQGAPR